MAEAFPSEYDAIVLGTGLPEAVVAAALSRAGYRVLHLDRNDYYSSYWASFSFDKLQEWIETNSTQETKGAQTSEDNNVKGDLRVPLHGDAIFNIEVRSFLRESDPDKESGVGDGKEAVNKASELEAEAAGASFAVNPNVGSPHIEGRMTDESVPEPSAENTAVQDKKHDGDDEQSETKQPCANTAKITPVPEGDADTSGRNAINWAERRKMKKARKLGRDATFESLSEQSRKFNLDLAPKVLFSRGLLVESLINANISHYAEFKIVSRILTYMNGNIEEVPCSRSDVFSSELLSMLEKRALMRFITFCANFEDTPEQYVDFQDKPFVDFLKSRKLTANLQHIIIHAIAMVSENTATLCGLKATQNFLRSLGRYGNTPFLWSLYGSGELPQAFCRMCAVFGGIYCLRKNVKCLVFGEDSRRCLGVVTEDDQRLTTKWLIMETSYAPKIFQMETQTMISRAILITDRSLKPSSREHVTLMSLPSNSSGAPVRVIELAPSSMACPESLYVVHLICETSSTALEDLECHVKQLFTTPDKEDEKPAVLWAVYFNRKCSVSKDASKIPENVKLTALPSSQVDFEDAMKEAKEIFSAICPGEEFLAAVPNPEDIIWDDVNCDNEKQLDVGQQPTPDAKEKSTAEKASQTESDGKCSSGSQPARGSNENITEDSHDSISGKQTEEIPVKKEEQT